MRRAFALAMLIGLTLSGNVSAKSLPPVDEGSQDPGFKRFRAQFLEIVRKRDLSSLASHLHPNIKVSLGNGSGVEAAMKVMREQPSRWNTLARILGQGGKFKTFDSYDPPVRMFFAPYTHFAELESSGSSFDVAVVTGSNVNVRKSASATAPVIARLSHQVVHAYPQTSDDENWIRIRTPRGKSGYVSRNYVAWPTDFRAGFEMHEGKWKLRVCLAGD